MKNPISMLIAAVGLSFSASLLAESRPDHYQGEPAETLEQAVQNFSQYNKKLSEILKQDSLSPQDLHQVHQLTYTLENALERMQTDLGGLAETLEVVHLASENADENKVRDAGEAYLQTSQKLVK